MGLSNGIIDNMARITTGNAILLVSGEPPTNVGEADNLLVYTVYMGYTKVWHVGYLHVHES